MSESDKPGDRRFFSRTGPHALGAIAAAAGATTDAPSRMFTGVAPLQTAGPEDVSFLDNKRYASLLDTTRAGAVILAPEFARRVPDGTAALATTQPYVGWARVASLFHPFGVATPGIHPRAIVDETAAIDPTAEIGAGAVIGPHVSIGAGSIIGPLAVIGAVPSGTRRANSGARITAPALVVSSRLA
jgi:UDP-3-O-[3-hydroxymyristoyl] glucosamine N-acyltransferase